MLQTGTVKATTLGLLKALQAEPALSSVRLVGGTALSLQLGHRESDDLDFDYRKKGGTNFFLFAVGIFAVMDLPGILFTLFFK